MRRILTPTTVGTTLVFINLTSFVWSALVFDMPLLAMFNLGLAIAIAHHVGVTVERGVRDPYAEGL